MKARYYVLVAEWQCSGFSFKYNINIMFKFEQGLVGGSGMPILGNCCPIKQYFGRTMYK